MKTIKFWAITLASLAIFFGVLVFSERSAPDKFNLAIFSIVEIEPITQLRQGFLDEFEKSSFYESNEVLITRENAQGDSGLINQIADKIVLSEPDLIYVLGTPAAQALQQRDPNLLIVQGAATDPVSAGLADSWEGSGRQYIATSDLPSIPEQVKLIQGLTPQVKRLGVIYNPGESNSVVVIERLREYIENQNLDLVLVERAISNSSEAARAVETLAGSIDALYLPPDNTAFSAIEVIGKLSKENQILLYATAMEALDEGAIATLSLNWYEVGKDTASLTLKVLDGEENPKDIPIQIDDSPVVTINSTVADEYNLDISAYKNQKKVEIIE